MSIIALTSFSLFHCSAAVKHAIKIADGIFDHALELLLDGVEGPFTDVSDDERSPESGHVQIVHQQHLAGSKRPRPAPDASSVADNNGRSADEVHVRSLIDMYIY